MGRRRLPGSRRATSIIAGVLVVLLTAGSVLAFNYDWLRAQYQQLTALDYQGAGTAEVTVRIESGDDGLVIARKLFDAGVVRDADSFYRLMLQRNPVFYPGSFVLRLQMSNESALSVITNQSNVLSNRVVIPEGHRARQIFEEISKATGIEVAALKVAASDLAAYGIPEQAPTIEGYLFPATYNFDLNASAEEIIRIMVNRTIQALIDAGVEKENWHEVLTLASIVEREAQEDADFYKVSRVFANRIEKGMPFEMDSTSNYSYDGSDTSGMTLEQKLLYGYDTYLVRGLPPGPISSPGELAIDATVNPVAGDWLFFVTINLATGETKFSNTLAEHESWVVFLRKWESENPNWYDE